MCGRFSLTLPADAMGRLFGAEVADTLRLAPRYNIAPSQPVAAVRRREGTGEGKGKGEGGGGGREIVLLRWGLIPVWTRDPDTLDRPPINARGETILAKKMFRDAFHHRRCLIPADGFYEWQKVPGGKQPWWIRRADGAPLAFAGIWERWRGRDGRVIESCAIVTAEANDTMRPIHDRMPVILDIGRFAPWLEASPLEAAELIEPYRGALTAWPVSRRVNDPHRDDANLVEPIAIAPAASTPPPTGTNLL